MSMSLVFTACSSDAVGSDIFVPLRCFPCHCDMDHVSVNKNKLKHKDTRQLLSHNVLKSRLVNTVTTRFSTSTGQMTEIKKI